MKTVVCDLCGITTNSYVVLEDVCLCSVCAREKTIYGDMLEERQTKFDKNLNEVNKTIKEINDFIKSKGLHGYDFSAFLLIVTYLENCTEYAYDDLYEAEQCFINDFTQRGMSAISDILEFWHSEEDFYTLSFEALYDILYRYYVERQN